MRIGALWALGSLAATLSAAPAPFRRPAGPAHPWRGPGS
jgi:hypothetical protein